LKIRLRYAGIISEITGKVSEEIKISDHVSLSDLLKNLASRYGLRFKKQVFDYEINKPADGILILLNGRIIRTNFNRKLDDKDFVSIMPMVCGG